MKNKGKFLAIPALLVLLVSLAVVAVVPVLASHTHTLQIVKPATGETASIAWVTNSTTSSANKIRVRLADSSNTATTTFVLVKNTTFTGAGSSIAAQTTSRYGSENIGGSLSNVTSVAYIGEVEIVDQAAANKIVASHGDTIQTTYTAGSHTFGKSAAVTVDALGPSIAALSPVHSTISSASSVTFSADIVDPDSKIGTTGAGATLRPADNAIIFTIGGETVTGASVTYTAITNGWRATVSGALAEGAVAWYVTAVDTAGNKTRTDRDTTTVCNSYTGGNCETFSLTIDKTKPILSRAKVGLAWKASTKTTEAKRDSVQLEFVKATATAADAADTEANFDLLDGGTVSASDFLVEGSTITGVVFPNLAKTTTQAETRHLVYLTLAADLAPDAKPKVRVVNEVKDLAGNAQSSGELTAQDKNAPKFTVTITGTAASRAVASAAATSNITIRIVADEELTIGGVDVVITTLTSTTATPFVKVAARAQVPAPKVSGLARTYELVRKIGDSPGSGSRLLSVLVKGTDLSGGNVGTAGQGDAVNSAVDLTKATLFEFDNALADPTLSLTPAVTGKPTETAAKRPFLKLDFSSEASEYGLVGVSPTSVTVGTTKIDLDGHNAVTLTKVELDTVDVLAAVGTVTSNTFLVTPSADLALGEHKLVVNATDTVGNKLSADKTFTFTVVARAAHKISLVPGWNLVSFPGDPETADIDTVLAGNAAISTVLSYAPGDPDGPWLVATRTDAGLSGTIKNISAQRAYWIKTTTFDPVSAVLKERAFSQLPPTIGINTGWNLVPVGDIQLQAVGTEISASTYFASITWTVAYHFNTANNTWSKIVNVAGMTDKVKVGEGWWVFATKAGELVP